MLERRKAITKQELLIEFEKEVSKFSVKWLIHLLFKYLLSRTHFLMLLSSVKQVFPPTPLEDVYICPPMAPTNHSRLLQLYMFQTEYRQTSLLHQKGELVIVNSEIPSHEGLHPCHVWCAASVNCTGLYWHMETRGKKKKERRKNQEYQVFER